MTETIPVVTLWQPWATLVEILAKPFETRTFRIPERLLGRRVGIHAASRPVFTGFDEATEAAITDALNGPGWRHWLPRGAIVATAVLAETIATEDAEPDPFGDYGANRFAWRLADVRPVRPHIPAKGRQMIGWAWEPPPGFVA